MGTIYIPHVLGTQSDLFGIMTNGGLQERKMKKTKPTMETGSRFPKGKVLCAAVLLAAGLAAPGSASAGDGHWYAFGAVGTTAGGGNKAFLDDQLRAAGERGFQSSLATPNIYKIGIGVQLNDNLALEGGYLRSEMTNYTATGGSVSGTIGGLNIFDGGFFDVTGILPLTHNFSLLGRLGTSEILHTAGLSGPGFSVYASGVATDWTYGIGAQYRLTDAIAVRLDGDTYDVGGPYSAYTTIWTLGLTYGFHS